MRTKIEILDKMVEIETERKGLLNDYQYTTDETERGIIAERHMYCLQLIQQLNWVLNE